MADAWPENSANIESRTTALTSAWSSCLPYFLRPILCVIVALIISLFPRVICWFLRSLCFGSDENGEGHVEVIGVRELVAEEADESERNGFRWTTQAEILLCVHSLTSATGCTNGMTAYQYRQERPDRQAKYAQARTDGCRPPLARLDSSTASPPGVPKSLARVGVGVTIRSRREKYR